MNQTKLIRRGWLASGCGIISLVLHLTVPALTAHAQGDGIYADFNTSMGSFTCRLHYVLAPKAVGNFVGLATGQRAWLDAGSGRIRNTPFYDGIVFHRVIADFMSQAGSPNQQGTDGPGYTFPDEFSPSLLHTNFGVLSMANAYADGNGSQFFLTASAQQHLDGKHAVFGQLVGGSNVVYAINHVATSTDAKPLVDVVIQQVRIRRVGAAAQAFNIQGQGLPLMTNVPLALSLQPGQVSLSFSNRLHVENLLCSTVNLTAWSPEALGFEAATPSSPSTKVRAMVGDRRFYRVVQVAYPQVRAVPLTVNNRVLKLGGDILENLTITFNNTGGGTYTFAPYFPPGTVVEYIWEVDAYRGRLLPIYFSGLVPMFLHFGFTNATGGTYSGILLNSTQTPVSGGFTLSP